MRYNFIDTITQITKELGGNLFTNQNKQWYDLGISFNDGGYVIFDYLDLKVSLHNRECGVIIKSSLTNGKYVSLTTYTFLLVEWLEEQFGKTISLKPFTSRFYFLGEVEEKNIQILN